MRACFITREQEQVLARRWRDHGDEKAMHKLVLAYQPLAEAMVMKYKRFKSISREDLKQEAFCGLLLAAQKFDPDRNLRFSTYARWWILSTCQDFIMRNMSVVRESLNGHNRTEAIGKLLKRTDFSLDIRAKYNGLDLDTFGDLLPDESEDQHERLERVEAIRQVRSALDTLKPRTRQCVIRREDETLEEIGLTFGISKERVRQIEAAGHRELRKKLEAFA